MHSGSTSDLTLTVHADEVVERPVDNVWVVAADDMDLGPRLINSVVHGEWGGSDHSYRCMVSGGQTTVIGAW